MKNIFPGPVFVCVLKQRGVFVYVLMPASVRHMCLSVSTSLRLVVISPSQTVKTQISVIISAVRSMSHIPCVSFSPVVNPSVHTLL